MTTRAPLAGKRVLVVEDEPVVAMMLEDMLIDSGAEVAASASTLALALAAVAEENFDLAVLDINLHGERSLPVAGALHDRRIPFVVATGYGAFDAHGAPCVAKPYQQRQLVAALIQAMNQCA